MFCPRKFRVIGSWSSMFIMQIFSLELSLQIRHRFYFWFFSAKIYQMLPAIYPSGIFPTLKLNWVISIKVDWCKICLIHPKTNWSAGSGSNHDYHSRVSFCQFTCYLILEIIFRDVLEIWWTPTNKLNCADWYSSILMICSTMLFLSRQNGAGLYG